MDLQEMRFAGSCNCSCEDWDSVPRVFAGKKSDSQVAFDVREYADSSTPLPIGLQT
jgi:hypothetical protein